MFAMSRLSVFILIVLFFSASAFAKVTVYGTVVGVDGKPMTKANVFLTYPSDDRPVESVTVGKDGGYRIEIGSEGLWMLHFTGTYHHEYSVAIYANSSKSIRLDVGLRAYRYAVKLGRVRVIGNFNDWSKPSSAGFTQDKGGTYSTVVDSKSDTVFYRLLNVRTGGEIEGTDADGFVPHNLECYDSYLIAKRGKVRIVFDPRRLVRSTRPPRFRMLNADSTESGVAKAYALLEDTRDAYMSSLYWHIEEYKMGDFRFDFAGILDSTRHLLDKEPAGVVRQVLHLTYFALRYLSLTDHYVDVGTSRATLEGIPPGSVVWSLDPSSIMQAISLASFPEPQKDRYVDSVLNSNPMKRTKEILLKDQIDRKFYSLQYSFIPRYLEILVDQYGDSPEAVLDRERYSAYLLLKDGSRAPEFTLRSLGDSSQVFDNDYFKGKFFLLYFWAASSRASVDEMSNLRKAFEKYHGKNFEILGVSLDSSAGIASRSLLSQGRVNWPNALDSEGLGSEICRKFEVYSIPKAVLVNPDGIVVASGWELRGPNLLESLAKYVGR
jgi:peroxiredoxin